MPPDPLLISLAKAKAKQYGLDPALVCAVCEQESNWNPWAIRYEPAFYAHYEVPLIGSITSTEAHARALSWGLMQAMGQVAREAGYRAPFLSELLIPQDSLDIGCQILRNKLNHANGDVRAGLQRYNGGGNPNYADQVIARMQKYKES